jgi:hypothetical protein
MEQTGEDSHGQAQILVTVGRSSFSSTGGQGPGIEKSSEDHDEKFLGNRRPGHEVQIFLTADATYLMRKVTSDAVIPIGWPPLGELREKIVAKHIPVFA